MNPLRVRNLLSVLLLSLSGLSSSIVYASDDLDVTMRMVTDDAALTDSIVREIRLDQPVNLESRSDLGEEIAREAREDGRAFGKAAAEQAREAAQLREELTRPERPETPDIPDNQDGPTNPAPPDAIPDGAAR